ncbi:MAG: erythromycin esterase family protein [Planctomycetota bacterium]
MRFLESGRPIERELAGGGSHFYALALEKGQFLDAVVDQRGIDVVIRIFAPDGGRLAEIDSPNGTQGLEPVQLEANVPGTYRIEVRSLEANAPAGRYEIRINEILSTGAHAARLAEDRKRREVVVAWLRANALPLDTVEPGHGIEDLQPLENVFRDVRIVGLGEETHGTSEFFRFKHRLLEFLVREMGFRVLVMEAGYAACQGVNDYVAGRTDDGAGALAGLGFAGLNTKEIQAMLDWVRAYNAGVGEGRKVEFAGIDIQRNDAGKEKLLAFLRRVAPERVVETEAFFGVNLEELNMAATSPHERKFRDAMEKIAGLKTRYNDLIGFLESNGTRLTEKTSPAEFGRMREYARVIVQYLDAYGRSDGSLDAARDRHMADNFRRLVEREPAGTRFVLWAHNGHVSVSAGGALGGRLRQWYGNAYYALGFSFNHGAFQAHELYPKDPARRMLKSFRAGPAPGNTVDGALAECGIGRFLVDFRSTQKNAVVDEWLSTPHPMRSIGSLYAENMARTCFDPVIPGREFDGLVFLDATTRARPNPSVKNVEPVE